MELKQEIWSLSLKSRPHRDPCRRMSLEPGQDESYDDLMVSPQAQLSDSGPRRDIQRCCRINITSDDICK